LRKSVLNPPKNLDFRADGCVCFLRRPYCYRIWFNLQRSKQCRSARERQVGTSCVSVQQLMYLCTYVFMYLCTCVLILHTHIILLGMALQYAAAKKKPAGKNYLNYRDITAVTTVILKTSLLYHGAFL